MAQHDYNIANQTAANARTDINNVLSAIATNNSGASEPSTTFANQWWYETDTNLLKMRNEANDAWITVAYLASNNYYLLENTIISNTSGTGIGLLAGRSTAIWETGTSTTESLVSPAKLKAAADSATESKLNISGTAPIYGVRAWVNFDGTGSTSANQTLRANGNIASVYKNTTGNYTVTFTTAMPDEYYAVLYGAGLSTGVSSDNGTTIDVYDQVAGSFKANITDPTGNNRVNPPRCYMTIVR